MTDESQAASLPKSPTGIAGFDEITRGGLPHGRTTLVCGGPGCGKTLFGMEFLLRGIHDYNEPGLFVTFEETAAELTRNLAPLGYDLDVLCADDRLAIDHVRIERSEIEETGEYDLDALFIRIGFAIDRIQARRVVLDTVESLFAALANEATLRAELRRLFHWLKTKGVTSVITAERGTGALTRHGLEEYVSDCVVLLDHRITDQISTRRLRVVKYRGSAHGTNEFPFIIDETGFSVFPITSAGLTHAAPEERASSGIARLDAMLGGGGFYRGSSILVSGSAGTGKSTLAAQFTHAACGRGERVLYFAFEESPDQITRNMRTVGLDLAPWQRDGLLRVHATRPTLYGLETHLAITFKLLGEVRPACVVIDPITNLVAAGSVGEVRTMLTRLIDFLKSHGVTALFTGLTTGAEHHEQTEVGVSSLMDTWILLSTIEGDGDRKRGLYVLKSRGMNHSNQTREFRMTDHGVELADIHLGRRTTRAERSAQQARERAEAEVRERQLEARRREIARKRAALEAQMATMRADLAAEQEALDQFVAEEHRWSEIAAADAGTLQQPRGANPDG